MDPYITILILCFALWILLHAVMIMLRWKVMIAVMDLFILGCVIAQLAGCFPS